MKLIRCGLFRRLCVVASVCFCLLSLAQAVSHWWQTTASSRAVCVQPYFDWGDRRLGASVQHAFSIENVGRHEIQMRDIVPSCSCVRVGATQDTVSPGAAALVPVTVQLTGAPGRHRYKVVVATTSPLTPRIILRLEGNVIDDGAGSTLGDPTR